MRWIFVTLLLLNAAYFLWHGEVGMLDRSVGMPVVEVTSAQSLKSLQLLSEVKNKLLLKGREPELLPQVQSTEGAESLCTLVGPFSQLLAAENMIENLQALEIVASMQNLEVPEGPGYWVHLPPEDSRKAALRRLRELQSRGIDSYVIPKGDLANGISFGMFSRKALAEKRLKVMQAQGYDAEINQVKRSHQELWVMFPAGEVDKVADEFWLHHAPKESLLERRQNFCLGVATEGKYL
tara:strand:+ start:313 stop:1026 length:714 start_codon:yes stop_codon:yes gene_type:complete